MLSKRSAAHSVYCQTEPPSELACLRRGTSEFFSFRPFLIEAFRTLALRYCSRSMVDKIAHRYLAMSHQIRVGVRHLC